MGGSRKVNLVKFLSWLNRRVDPLTELKPVATVDVEVMIARLPLSAEGVEDKTIWAQPVLWDVVETVVVFVALNWVGEVAVPLRTSEVGLGWGGEVNVRGFSGKETVIEEWWGLLPSLQDWSGGSGQGLAARPALVSPPLTQALTLPKV